ncbi:hypothetical protein [Actinokineospora alba]|uniref:hypothetical protein n=1 Tax=Actinokineospora alba TaxID=504798 RepID=UPI00105C0139|nr:hypothetical protein [Actinokineospora alba]
MTGTGFRADTTGMRGSAKGFRSAGEQVGSARGELDAATVPEGTFGISGPGPMLAADLDNIMGRRRESVSRRQTGLVELATGIEANADAFDRAESDNTQGVERSGEGL